MSHRLFFGIRPPAPVRDRLLDLMDGIDNARWQDDDQLHLTLRYVGDVETHIADDLADEASAIRFEPFELSIASVGHFESKGIVRSIWAGVARSEALGRLQARIERLCQSVGLSPSDRGFLPHLTLARMNSSAGSPATFLARNAGLSLGPFRVGEYILYESTLRPEGSLYEPIVRYPASYT